MYFPSKPLGPLIFDTTDRFGKRIILELDRYTDHIVDGHPEMAESVLAIQESIEKAIMIYRSTQFPHRVEYVATSKNATYPSLPIKTIVDHTFSDFGFVVTSLHTPMKRINPKGDVLYDQNANKNQP